MFLNSLVFITLQLITAVYNDSNIRDQTLNSQTNKFASRINSRNIPAAYRNDIKPRIIENNTFADIAICNTLFSPANSLNLEVGMSNLVNANHGSNSVWSAFWNVIPRTYLGGFLTMGLTHNVVNNGLIVAQTSGTGSLVEEVPNAYVQYSEDTQTFSQARQVCRVKISDPDISAIIYDIYTTYHGTVDWFFCLEISINFYFTPDDDVGLGVDSKKFHLSVIFEDTCGESGPTPLLEEVYRIENLDFSVLV